MATQSIPTGSARAELIQVIREIHDQYEIDSTKGCFELQTPYEVYHEGLQQMTASLWSHPYAQGFALEELESMFEEVAGFSVDFIPGNGEDVLVVIPTNRGHNLGCGSHYRSPDAYYVVDKNGFVWDLGVYGLYGSSWWVDERWMVLIKGKLDASSGPTPWSLWHVGREGGKWYRMVEYQFNPVPYDFEPFPIRFENGYEIMVAENEYWWADDPCEFVEEFRDLYRHGDWRTRNTYRLVEGGYQLTAVQVLDFPVFHRDTGESADVNWRNYCIDLSK